MASKTVVTCDRCGKEITQPTLPLLHIEYTKRRFFSLLYWRVRTITKQYELCEDCKKSFFNWMDKRDDS